MCADLVHRARFWDALHGGPGHGQPARLRGAQRGALAHEVDVDAVHRNRHGRHGRVRRAVPLDTLMDLAPDLAHVVKEPLLHFVWYSGFATRRVHRNYYDRGGMQWRELHCEVAYTTILRRMHALHANGVFKSAYTALLRTYKKLIPTEHYRTVAKLFFCNVSLEMRLSDVLQRLVLAERKPQVQTLTARGSWTTALRIWRRQPRFARKSSLKIFRPAAAKLGFGVDNQDLLESRA
jgi:hypothetical protein